MGLTQQPDSWQPTAGTACAPEMVFHSIHKCFLSAHQQRSPVLGAAWQVQARRGQGPRSPLGLPLLQRRKAVHAKQLEDNELKPGTEMEMAGESQSPKIHISWASPPTLLAGLGQGG